MRPLTAHGEHVFPGSLGGRTEGPIMSGFIRIGRPDIPVSEGLSILADCTEQTVRVINALAIIGPVLGVVVKCRVAS